MQSNKSVTITLIIVVGVLLAISLAIFGFRSIIAPQNTVNVEGIGTIETTPDLIGIYFNVEASGETSAEATQKNAQIVEDLKTNLIAKGFSEDEIKTQNFNVYPDYDWSNGQQKFKGYKATHSIKLEMPSENSKKIGEAIDAGVNAGAGISYINFELSTELENSLKAEAMKFAAQDARIKAEAVAEGFDKRLGKLVSTSVNDWGCYPMRAYDVAMGESVEQTKEAVTQITPSEQEITARVNAVYKIW